MKMRTTVIFSVLILSASLFSAPRPLIAAETTPDYFTIPQAELLDAEFATTRWGGTVGWAADTWLNNRWEKL